MQINAIKRYLIYDAISMIQLVEQGIYHLIESKGHTKILILDKKKTFAWINVADIGEILVTSHKSHTVDHLLAAGKYRLYTVLDEKNLTDLEHLELFVGEGLWQGYLLTNGLPNDEKKETGLFLQKKSLPGLPIKNHETTLLRVGHYQKQSVRRY